jgi:hypothetical protein
MGYLHESPLVSLHLSLHLYTPPKLQLQVGPAIGTCEIRFVWKCSWLGSPFSKTKSPPLRFSVGKAGFSFIAQQIQDYLMRFAPGFTLRIFSQVSSDEEN